MKGETKVYAVVFEPIFYKLILRYDYRAVVHRRCS